MKIEIERKFLVCGEDWRGSVLERWTLRQGYLACDEKKVIRVRTTGDRGVLTIKQAVSSLARREYEYDIPWEEARWMVEDMSLGFVVEKNRHRVGFAGKLWEVDEFLGENRGLVVAEIELFREDEVFDLPSWVGREVTEDLRFSNAALSRQPFSLWSDRNVFLADGKG